MQEEPQSLASDQNEPLGTDNPTTTEQVHEYVCSGCTEGRDRPGPPLSPDSPTVSVRRRDVQREAAAVSAVSG